MRYPYETTHQYRPGSVAERTATIRHAAAIMSALYHATVPILTVIIRRAFGVAGGAVADPGDGLNTRVAWYVPTRLVSDHRTSS